MIKIVSITRGVVQKGGRVQIGLQAGPVKIVGVEPKGGGAA